MRLGFAAFVQADVRRHPPSKPIHEPRRSPFPVCSLSVDADGSDSPRGRHWPVSKVRSHGHLARRSSTASRTARGASRAVNDTADAISGAAFDATTRGRDSAASVAPARSIGATFRGRLGKPRPAPATTRRPHSASAADARAAPSAGCARDTIGDDVIASSSSARSGSCRRQPHESAGPFGFWPGG